jgi:glycosyltransferase involved in cell wall biosynthesis
VRLLLITAMWPTQEHPASGSFVADRVGDVADITVVGPRRSGGWWLAKYAQLGIDAIRARGSFDGIEAHAAYPAGLIGLVLARLRGLPLLVYAHGSDVRRANTGRWIYRQLVRRVVLGADVVVTNSTDTASHVRALGRDPRIIPPGVDLRRFSPSPRPALRRVLYLGGRTPGKGYEVARELADTLAGPGEHEVAPAEVPALIAAHDIVLMPSVQEGFGVVAVEAIASGRWVVATAIGGLPEIIQDGLNGTLVSDGAFARALEQVPDYDPWVVAPTAARFDLDGYREAMAQLWRDLVSRRKERSARSVRG